MPWTSKSGKIAIPVVLTIAALVPAFAMWWQQRKL
jgi:hypothetical protein